MLQASSGRPGETRPCTSRETESSLVRPPDRRQNFRPIWVKACADAGIPGVHFHDLRHTGSTAAAITGATIKELMARLGHSSPRAAMIYQHATRDRDKAIADALGQLADKAPHYAIWPGAGPAFYPHDSKAFEICWSTCGAGDGNRTRMTSLEGFGSGDAGQPGRRSSNVVSPSDRDCPRFIGRSGTRRLRSPTTV
jgi:Phage integrase family